MKVFTTNHFPSTPSPAFPTGGQNTSARWSSRGVGTSHRLQNLDVHYQNKKGSGCNTEHSLSRWYTWHELRGKIPHPAPGLRGYVFICEMGEIISIPSLLGIKWWYGFTSSSLALFDTEKGRKEKNPENGPDLAQKQPCGCDSVIERFFKKCTHIHTHLIQALWNAVDLGELKNNLVYKGSSWKTTTKA